ncbi:Uncharacterized protein SCF082_LOCUS45183, partial [Durusdinium trenchii]
MALQRFSASSSSDYESYSDDGTSEAQSDVSIEPAAKRPKPMVESMRNLSWNQLQSLELDADGVQVCRQAWLHILGIGRERLMRCKRNFRGTDGVATYLDDDRKEVLLELAEYLESNYHHYSRGVQYLRMLAGQVAMPRAVEPDTEYSIKNVLTSKMEEITASCNMGKWLWDKYGSDAGMDEFKSAMIQIFAMDSVKKHIEHVKPVTHVPMTSMKGLYLDIWDLSFREDAKYGEVGRWPATHAYKAHFGSFLEHGFQSHRECLDIKFSNTAVETTNPVFAIDRFSEISEELLVEDDQMAKTLASFRYVKCNYQRHAKAEDFLYETLCLANRTAEKTKPSALDMMLLFKESVRLIYNLLRCPTALWEALKACYNESKPEQAALTMENMDGDYFVPGTELLENGPKIWQDIQTVTAEAVELWADRAMADRGRGLDPNFDYKKMGFVMEACGKQQEEHVISAQSSVNDARKSSLRAAFNLLLTNVANDQCLQDKFLATAEMNSCRADASTFSAKNEPWLQATLTAHGDGIRRPNQERIVLWINYAAAGVVPAKKILFTLEQVQQILHGFPRTAVAFVLLPNRAADLRSSPRKEEKEEPEEEKEEEDSHPTKKHDEGLSEMLKVERGNGKFATDTRLTRVQELKQAQGLKSRNVWACSTSCHSQSDTAYCASVIGQKTYSLCRSGSLKLPGFPSFESVVADLKNNAHEPPVPDFQVCVPVPNGLAIKQNLVDYWTAIDTFQVPMAELLEAHNKKYNPHGIKRGASDTAGPEGEGGTATNNGSKKMRIDNCVKVADHEGTIADKLVLACGNVRFVYDCKEDNLWICGNDSKKKETFEVKGPLEVFGFGSGDFVEGPEASDVQSDVLTYRDAISQLENAGEVNVKVSMHSLDKKDGSSEMSICSQKKVCFVLDQPKENKKKKGSAGAAMVIPEFDIGSYQAINQGDGDTDIDSDGRDASPSIEIIGDTFQRSSSFVDAKLSDTSSA